MAAPRIIGLPLALVASLLACASPKQGTPPDAERPEETADTGSTTGPDLRTPSRTDAAPGAPEVGGAPSAGEAGADMPATDVPGGSPSDPRSCGSTARDCTRLPNVKPGAAVTCQGGACMLPPDGCASGFVDCNDKSDDGCEADLTRPQTCVAACAKPAVCCSDDQCTGNRACVNGACSATQCRATHVACGTDCIPKGTCCRAAGCCAHSDCPNCQKCVSGACVKQGTSEDLKDECASGTCRTGNCDGNGGCGVTPNGQSGPGCNAAASCTQGTTTPAQYCQSGQCKRDASVSCKHYGCASSTRCATSCPDGTNDTGSACAPCGGVENATCCNSGKPCRKADLICYSGDNTCTHCGHGDGPCCGADRTAPGGFATAKGTCETGLVCDLYPSGWGCF